jgi:DNA-binding NarL/FixJ family response regulator
MHAEYVTGVPGERLSTATATETALTVAVLASDPIVSEGTVAYLRTCPGVIPLAPNVVDRADVVLVLACDASEITGDLLAHLGGVAPGREIRLVLVCDGISEPVLFRALDYGQVSVLPRRDTGYERILRALRNAHAGKVELPESAQSWLAARIRAIKRDVLDPHGLTAAGLYTREVEVLRLLAEGLDTLEIAERLSYSERTVKNIIHGLLARLKLKNRSHAVAYALRNGVL